MCGQKSLYHLAAKWAKTLAVCWHLQDSFHLKPDSDLGFGILDHSTALLAEWTYLLWWRNKPVQHMQLVGGLRFLVVVLGHLALNARGAMVWTISDCAANRSSRLCCHRGEAFFVQCVWCFLSTVLTCAFSQVIVSLSTQVGGHLLPFLMHSSFLKWILAICDSPCGAGETMLLANSSVCCLNYSWQSTSWSRATCSYYWEVWVSWHASLHASSGHGTGQKCTGLNDCVDLCHYPYALGHAFVDPLLVSPHPLWFAVKQAIFCSKLAILSSSCHLELRVVGHMPCR